MILLDTHTLLWLDGFESRLGEKARVMALSSWDEGRAFVSVISFWEVAGLVRKGRLRLQETPEGWRRVMLGTGIREIDLSGEVAITSQQLAGFHGDPADRIIAATAIARELTLITADRQILSWEGPLLRADARD